MGLVFAASTTMPTVNSSPKFTLHLQFCAKSVLVNTMFAGMRMITPRVGMRGRIASFHRQPLPTDLPDGCEVEVVQTLGQTVVVRQPNGREWEVFYFLVDCGQQFRLNERWYHESEPVVLDYLEARLRELRSKKPLPALAPDVADVIENEERILRRYGRRPQRAALMSC